MINLQRGFRFSNVDNSNSRGGLKARLPDPWFVFITGEYKNGQMLPEGRSNDFYGRVKYTLNEYCKLLDFIITLSYYYEDLSSRTVTEDLIPRISRDVPNPILITDIDQFLATSSDPDQRDLILEATQNLTGSFPKLILGTSNLDGRVLEVIDVLEGGKVNLSNMKQLFIKHRNSIFTKKSAIGRIPEIKIPFPCKL